MNEKLLKRKIVDKTKKAKVIVKNQTMILSGKAGAYLCKTFVFIFITLAAFGMGFLAAKLSLPSSPSMLNDEDLSLLLMEEIKSENIDTYNRQLTKVRHMSGTPAEEATVEYIVHFLQQLPLDKVTITPYTILLNKPDTDRPNFIRIHDKKGGMVFETMPIEDSLKGQGYEYQPFNAYSASATVKGPLVYVNYGRKRDFKLVLEKGNLKDKICLIRYGFNFRADKVKMAESHGCIGVILFSDPDDYVKNMSSKTYPHTWLLPEDGVQRGTVKKSSGGLGDPLTPFYPSTPEAYRIKMSEADLPKIPCQPISYRDSIHLLRVMGGEEVGDGWKGLLNVTYRYGFTLADQISDVELSVTNIWEQKEIKNVIGQIRGREEPDRYVMIGNHHDAWVYGGSDPNSGTAVLLEVARAVASVVARGAWRPRRSIVFCSWGAEEQGIIGSREFVEQYYKQLSDRAVAYLNVDSAVHGRYVFQGKALPLLSQLLYNATKKVTNPDEEEFKAGRKSVYDTWKHRTPDADLDVPKVKNIGAGSDHAAFVAFVGVPSVDIRFTYDYSLNISSYPLYHTAYDSHNSYSSFQDPGFKFSKALGQIWLEMVRSLASSTLIPIRPTLYSQALNRFFSKLKKKLKLVIRKHNIILDSITESLEIFSKATEAFDESLSTLDTSNILLLRGKNDQLLQLERCFINYMGLPGRPAIRHVLMAPSASNSYASSAFPGVYDTLVTLKDAPDDDPVLIEKLVADVQKQVAIVSFLLKAAAASLQEPELFAGVEA